MNEVERVLESDKVICFKANKILMEHEFDLLSNMVRQEQERSGVSIILVPFSCDVTLEKLTAPAVEDTVVEEIAVEEPKKASKNGK